MTESHSHANGRRKKHKPEKKGKQRAANRNGSKAGSEARSISKRIERRRNEESGIKEQGKGGIENKRLLGEKIETQRWRLPGGGCALPPSCFLLPPSSPSWLHLPSILAWNHPPPKPTMTLCPSFLLLLAPLPLPHTVYYGSGGFYVLPVLAQVSPSFPPVRCQVKKKERR